MQEQLLWADSGEISYLLRSEHQIIESNILVNIKANGIKDTVFEMIFADNYHYQHQYFFRHQNNCKLQKAQGTGYPHHWIEIFTGFDSAGGGQWFNTRVLFG